MDVQHIDASQAALVGAGIGASAGAVGGGAHGYVAARAVNRLIDSRNAREALEWGDIRPHPRVIPGRAVTMMGTFGLVSGIGAGALAGAGIAWAGNRPQLDQQWSSSPSLDAAMKGAAVGGFGLGAVGSAYGATQALMAMDTWVDGFAPRGVLINVGMMGGSTLAVGALVGAGVALAVAQRDA